MNNDSFFLTGALFDMRARHLTEAFQTAVHLHNSEDLHQDGNQDVGDLGMFRGRKEDAIRITFEAVITFVDVTDSFAVSNASKLGDNYYLGPTIYLVISWDFTVLCLLFLVDWTLKGNYLSIYLSSVGHALVSHFAVCLSVRRFLCLSLSSCSLAGKMAGH